MVEKHEISYLVVSTYKYRVPGASHYWGSLVSGNDGSSIEIRGKVSQAECDRKWEQYKKDMIHGFNGEFIEVVSLRIEGDNVIDNDTNEIKFTKNDMYNVNDECSYFEDLDLLIKYGVEKWKEKHLPLGSKILLMELGSKFEPMKVLAYDESFVNFHVKVERLNEIYAEYENLFSKSEFEKHGAVMSDKYLKLLRTPEIILVKPIEKKEINNNE